MYLFVRWLSVSVALCLGSAGFAPAGAGALTLALANSTCDAMSEAGNAYRARHGTTFTYVCKSSGMLVKGLRGGALTADLFVSADREWMDAAIENGLVAPDRVSSPWGNVLVVAAPKASRMQGLDWQELASDKVSVILIGDPGTAPFGRYAKEALEASGLWERVRHKIQTRKNIELLADSLAVSGPGTVGILFKTNLTETLSPLHSVDPKLHKPIRYYLAPLRASAANADVVGFLEFLRGKLAQDLFRAAGFDASAP